MGAKVPLQFPSFKQLMYVHKVDLARCNTSLFLSFLSTPRTDVTHDQALNICALLSTEIRRIPVQQPARPYITHADVTTY